MKLNKIAFAALAVASTGAFAATVTASCGTAANTDGVTLLKTCAPDITFYAPGATALKGAIQKTLGTLVDSTDSTSAIKSSEVFDVTKPIVRIWSGKVDSNAYAYYGFGATGKSYAGKKVAVIVNGTNGSMAGVNQLLSGLKSGSVEGGVDQQEYKTIQLHTAAAQKAGNVMPDSDVTVSTASTLSPIVILNAARVADFKDAWGTDKQKVAHMAFSDVRPSEATPGQIAKWDPKAFPSETIAMQGFGVLVNNNMYKALMKRDVNQGRILDSACDFSDASMLLAKCQPSVSSADMAALITGKSDSAAKFLGDSTETRVLNLSRRPNSSGTQAATQIRFAGQANYIGKTPLATGFDMIGADGATFTDGVVTTTTNVINAGFNVYTNSGTGDLIKKVQGDTAGLSIGVASLDNKASSKLGAGNSTAASRDLETARWVKVDGISPNFKGDGTVDGDQRVGLLNGYSFAFEFQTVKSSKLAGDYSAIYSDIVAGLRNPAKNLTGIAYIGSSDTAKNTTWTRNENNYFPLNK